MKKALAVMLAVMMLATLAFAALPVVPVESAPGAKIGANVTTKKDMVDPYLVLDGAYFSYFHDNCSDLPNLDIISKNFTVTGIPGGKFDDANKQYIIPIENKDVGQDGKADLVIKELKIVYGNAANKNYVIFKPNDTNGILTPVTFSVSGTEKSTPAVSTSHPMYGSLDIGRETTFLTAGATPITKSGWYRNDNGLETEFKVTAAGVLADTVSIKAAKDACFKLEVGEETGPVKIADVSLNLLAPSLKVKGATLKYAYPGSDLNSHCYGVKDGKAYASGLTLDGAVLKKTVTESMALYCTPYGVELPADKVLAAPGAPADPKNPPTGANDVVGVAAALAVVALVSGAAISLKK